jgi:predicted ester cyclase
MTKADLSDIYREYIACLNKQDWPNLGQFVHEEVYYNGERIRLSGYREMLEGDFRAIPDLYIDIHLVISEPPRVASRLRFDCTPKGILFGLHPIGSSKGSPVDFGLAELTGLEPDNFPRREATDNPKITLSPRMQAFSGPRKLAYCGGNLCTLRRPKGRSGTRKASAGQK